MPKGLSYRTETYAELLMFLARYMKKTEAVETMNRLRLIIEDTEANDRLVEFLEELR